VIELPWKPLPVRVPVIELSPTVAERVAGWNPAELKVRESDGESYVPCAVSGRDPEAVTRVPLPLTVPLSSINDRLSVAELPFMVTVPLQESSTPNESGPLSLPQADSTRHNAAARLARRMTLLLDRAILLEVMMRQIAKTGPQPSDCAAVYGQGG
jgi:hypothetical protein